MSSTWGETLTTLPGLTAAADLSSNQYKPVKGASTAGQVVAVNASTDAALGVQLDAPAVAGQPITVVGLGVVPMVAATSSITVGQRVGFDATGRVDPAHALKLGIALEAPGAIGDQIQILLTGRD